MNIDNVNVYGINDSIFRSKYPMKSVTTDSDYRCTPTTIMLGSCDVGTGHDQFLTGIIVQFDLTCSLKMWTELQRYHFIDFVSSQSTMHSILKFDINKKCNKYVTREAVNNLKECIERYNKEKTPENYLQILYNIPSGFELTAGMTTNYRQLKTIYKQRNTHILKEWQDFCKWIEFLPRFKEICLDE